MSSTLDTLTAVTLAVACGYGLGRLDGLIAYVRGPASKSFVSSVTRDQKQDKQRVDIDDRKFVTDIPSGFDGNSGVNLGTVTTTQDVLKGATDKLAQLKKKKG